MSDAPPNTIVKTATYIGRRTTSKNTLAHFWKFEGIDPVPKGWKKNIVPWAQPGDQYQIHVGEKGEVYTHGIYKPNHVGKHPVESEVLEWVGLDAAHAQHDTDRRMERRLKEQKTDFDKAIEPLRRMVGAVRNHDDRAALIAHITATLWRRHDF